MPANVEIDPTTVSSQESNYELTAFQTEDAGSRYSLTHFSWAGGSSSYSFGLYQFDTSGNPNITLPLLNALGFNSSQITELEQDGGLTKPQLSALNTQLQDGLATQSGQAALQTAISDWNTILGGDVQTDLNDASPTITSAIFSDPAAIQRLYDLNNQFGTGTLTQLQNFVGGEQAQPPGGDSISWNYSLSASANLQAFFFATAFGGGRAQTLEIPLLIIRFLRSRFPSRRLI
jgi:hypothetical protein